jgi:hypothetical protein
LIDGATVTRFIPSSACKRDPEGNRTCQVDGQLVAEWTGPAAPPPMLNQWFTSSAAPVEVKAQP